MSKSSRFLVSCYCLASCFLAGKVIVVRLAFLGGLTRSLMNLLVDLKHSSKKNPGNKNKVVIISTELWAAIMAELIQLQI